MSQQLLTASAAARFLGVHRHTVRAWMQDGRLQAAATADGVTLFEHDELQRRKTEMQGERRPGPKRETK